MRSSTIPAHAAHTWMPIELKTGDARAVGFERSKVTKATQHSKGDKSDKAQTVKDDSKSMRQIKTICQLMSAIRVPCA